jgi:hypothetical protein
MEKVEKPFSSRGPEIGKHITSSWSSDKARLSEAHRSGRWGKRLKRLASYLSFCLCGKYQK